MSDEKHEQHGSGAGGGEHAHAKGGHKKHHGGGHGGHEEHEEGVPEWVVSFADNALLQMGFFVILLALNLKPASDGHGGAPADNNASGPQSGSGAPAALIDGAIAIREAFNNPVNLSSSSPQDVPLVRRILQRREGTSKESGPPGDQRNVSSVRPTDYRRLGGLILFEESKTQIDDDSRQVAASISEQLQGRKTIVEVRGHVSLAEASATSDLGLRLSFDRALAVSEMLREGGLDPMQMRLVIVGAGDRASPMAGSKIEQRNNQRVEIVLTDELMPADPFAVDPAQRDRAAPR